MRNLIPFICCCLAGAVAALAVTGAFARVGAVPDANSIQYALDTRYRRHTITPASILIR